ncbi:MAG TPA: hypothetical protein G4O18_10185, partial [Dehalococcoidia bacterium]|nr:hypothetical protein [Dehalococcoidia bacterium]
MFFFPIGCLALALFVLLLPLLFIFIFFNVTTFSFEKLGISPEVALIILISTLFGSLVNIPLTKRTVQQASVTFGWFRIPVRRESGLAIN